MRKYKNVSGKDLFVRGVGLVKKDEEVKAEEISNKNFKEIKAETKQVTSKKWTTNQTADI